MDTLTKVSLILAIVLIVTVCVLVLIISNKNSTINNLELKLSISDSALIRQNEQIEALRINKDDLIAELNKTANEIANMRDKIGNMPIKTCQDKLNVIDMIFREASK